jgi:NAD(P)H-hydrate epimerase
MSDSGAAWPRAIYSSEQVRSLDRRAIEVLGIDAFELMQRAAGESLRFSQRRWPEARSLLIYCGAGNNGGDGYALAALATRAGLDARVIALADASALRGAAAQAVELARQSRVPVQRFAPSGIPGFEPDLVVDALIGTGLKRSVEAEIAAAVAAINASECPVLALDIPTGLDSDTGEVHGVAVRADATVTFVGLKSGLYLGAGPDHCGELAFAALDLPDSNSAAVVPVLRRCAAADVAR